MMTPLQYHECECEFRLVLDQCREKLSSEAMTDVEQRLEHGELEMAVESLCLSLRYEGVIVPDMACSHLLKLGPLLGLDRESVLELDFWTKTLPLLRAAQKS